MDGTSRGIIDLVDGPYGWEWLELESGANNASLSIVSAPAGVIIPSGSVAIEA